MMFNRSLQRWLLRSSLVLTSFMLVGGANCTASAESAPDTASLKRAREQFGRALALQTGGDWAGALALLKEVATVKGTPQVRFNIALCEEHLGRLVAALGDYELAGTDARAEKADLVRQEVDARLDALRARLPRIVVQRGTGAEGATIALDGIPLGDAVVGTPLPADPGPHVVDATAPGFLPFKQSFRVAEQQTASIEVTLQVEPSKPPPPAPVSPPFSRITSPGLRNAGYVVGGAGIASLIASGAMFYLRHNAINDLDQRCGADRMSCPEDAKSTADRGRLYNTLGNVTLVVGAASVAVGAVLVIVGGRTREQPKLALAPAATGANGGGLSLLGRF